MCTRVFPGVRVLAHAQTRLCVLQPGWGGGSPAHSPCQLTLLIRNSRSPSSVLPFPRTGRTSTGAVSAGAVHASGLRESFVTGSLSHQEEVRRAAGGEGATAGPGGGRVATLAESSTAQPRPLPTRSPRVPSASACPCLGDLLRGHQGLRRPPPHWVIGRHPEMQDTTVLAPSPQTSVEILVWKTWEIIRQHLTKTSSTEQRGACKELSEDIVPPRAPEPGASVQGLRQRHAPTLWRPRNPPAGTAEPAGVLR